MQFQSELELRVKVLDQELDKLEKRINKFANPFSASGGKSKSAIAKQQAQRLRFEKRITNVQLEAATKLEKRRTNSFNVAMRRQKYLRKERLRQERELATAQRKRSEGIKLGLGFPLLFGGGLGSVTGGLFGALTDKDGGFGGQILFSAIGQQLDEAVQRAAALGKAIRDIDASALDESLGGISTELARQVELLKNIGEEERARALLADEVARRTGLSADAAQQVNAAVEVLQRGWNDLVNSASAFVAIISAPLAGALGRLLQGLAMIIKGWNMIFSLIQKAHMAQVMFFSGEEGVKKLKEQYKQMYESIDQGEMELKVAREQYYKDLAVSKRFRGQEIELLKQELAIKKMTSQEDQYKKATAEANLKVEQARLNIEKARSEFFRAQFNKDYSGMTSARQKGLDASDNLARAQVEREIAVEAERVFNLYTKQADALQTVVTQSKLRLNAEQAVADARSKLTGAFYSAELKINQLAIQRAKQKGNTNQVLQLELRQVQLIYQQTVAQIQAEVERARIKARQVELATKELQVANLRKQAEGKLTGADMDAMKVQQQALALARNNVAVAQKVAEQQIRGAQAVYAASREALIYANNQNKVATAAERTANAQARGANAVARAAKSAGNWGSNAPWGLGPGQVRGGFVQDFRRTARTSGMTKAQQDYTKRMIKAGILSSTRIGAANYKKPLIGARGYAEGGFVTRPTQALVGERGENEYVIPESKMSSAMGRYARGDRGDSVVQGATNAEGKKGGSKAVVNVNTGPVMRMNNKDYVTVNDMNSALGSVVSAMSPSGGNYNSSARLG